MVTIAGLSTRLGLVTQGGEEHASTLEVASTSLRPGFVWAGPSSLLVVTLSASDSATLDTANVDDPVQVVLDTGDQSHDVTAWFLYDAVANTFTLDTAQGAAFKALLTDAFMNLKISGADSSGRHVSLIVPLQSGRFQITGTLAPPTGTPGSALAQTRVLLEGASREYRDMVMAGSDGSFSFDGVYGDDYTITATGPDGLLGTAVLRLDEAAADAQSATVQLVDWSGSGGPGSGSGFAAMAMSETIGGTVGAPWQPIGQATITIPQGTKTVQLNVDLWSGGFDENFWFGYYEHPTHPCQVVTQIGPYPAINNQYTYAIVLDDQLIASGGGNHCSTPVQEGSLGARLLDRVLDVSGATAGRDATLRLLATSTEANTFGTVGAINITASAPADFAVTAVTPFDGDGPIEAFRNGVKKGDKKIYKMIGIPDGSRATKNKWGLRVRFEPADAEILSVRPFVSYPTGASEDLHFTEPYTTTKGLITLNDVGFNQPGGARALWTTKSDEASLSVEVQAKMPDQTTVTKTAKLGVGGALNTHAGWNLTPLYDAGLITGALRYPTNNREEAIGRDGWGIFAAWEFLTAHNTLRFNDLSLEVGGPWPPHGAHQVGTSIDIIYLGPGGLGNALNTNPATRLNRWQQAKSGDVDARREMVAWIRANRAAMDAIFTDNRVAKILVGNAKWNFNPIVYGTFADGTTQVTDPDDNDNPIGAWSVTKAQAEDGHLDHLHIELNTRSQGNSIP